MSSAAAASSLKEGNNEGSKSSTLSILKQLRVDSTGFFDFYGKLWKHITGSNLCVIVGSIFLNDCQAEPMLPIYLIVTGVVSLSIQTIDQIAGSLLKKENTNWEKAHYFSINPMLIFMFCWFVTGCVWVFSMSLPNMTRFPDSVTATLPGFMNDLLTSLSTSSLPNDQFASVNSTMVSLLSPAKHCVFPVYGLAVWMVSSHLVRLLGYYVIVTGATIILFLLPEIQNVKKMGQLQMTNVY